MNKIALLLILLTVSGTTMATENDFWQWFVKHQSSIEAFDEHNQHILDELLVQLHNYNDQLYLELSTNTVENELVITAEGDPAQFDSVRQLVAKAPALKNWTFTAFMPAMGFDFISTYEGVDYDPDHLWFMPLENESDPSAFGIRVGIKDFDEKAHQHSEAAIWIILNTALGELACAEDIHYMETTALPEHPEKAGFIELVELPDYLDKHKNNKK
jgi:hypothetical protein